MKRRNAHNLSFIIVVILCYVCSVFTCTGVVNSPETGLQEIIAELQHIDASHSPAKQKETSEGRRVVTNLLYTTAEIICTHQSVDGEQQESLIVHLDYSHLLPSTAITFHCTFPEKKINELVSLYLERNILPETPPPKSIA